VSKAKTADPASTQCYCKSGLNFSQCCQTIINGTAAAKTAEALMRSRYTAFCLHYEDYLLQTWHPSTRPKDIAFEAQQQWLGLNIINHQAGGISDQQGQVEFIARYKINGRAYRLHENSDFVCENGRWYYTHGTLFDQ
jgi:SEC-C motif-containing protein